MGIVSKFFSGVYNLGLGLATTLKYLPKPAITIQYPKKKMEMFERFRGMPVLLSNLETGELNCNACLLCQKACPVAAISIVQFKDPVTKKRRPESFEINTLICCYCGLCEEVCNFDAIKLAPKYEFASSDKQSLLIFDMKKLQEIGRDVKYTPRKKRAAGKASDRPAKKAAEAGSTADSKAEKKDDAQAKTDLTRPAEKNPDNDKKPEEEA
jgi:NADH-quinone oxidoreductase subunit I